MVNSVSGSTAALQGQIQRATLDLNDWVTCVSAKTPKGQAEIQKFSGQISSAKEQISRLTASTPKATTSPASPASIDGSASTAATSSSRHDGRTGQTGTLLDAWA